MSAASIIERVIIGCGVKGYTAMTASALQFLMIATSVEKIKDRIKRPKTRIPVAVSITSGKRMIFERRVPRYSGTIDMTTTPFL